MAATKIDAVVGLGSVWIDRPGLLVMAPILVCWVLNGFAGDGFDGFEWIWQKIGRAHV